VIQSECPEEERGVHRDGMWTRTTEGMRGEKSKRESCGMKGFTGDIRKILEHPEPLAIV